MATRMNPVGNASDAPSTGKLSKFYAGCVLSEQPWILDDKTSVHKALEKELGPGTRIQAFQRVKLGA